MWWIEIVNPHMILKDFLPSPELLDFVRCYRIVHFTFGKSDIIPVKAYPPKPESILHYFLKDRFAIEGDDRKITYQPPVTYVGQRTFVTTQINGSDFLNFQIVFQPAAVYRLTGIPAYETSNGFFQAQDIFSCIISDTYEQLQEAKGYADLIQTGERIVRGLVKSTKREGHKMDALVRQSTRLAGNLSMRWLASESCLCTKQFTRRFVERTGVNPKLFERISRFNRAYNTRNSAPNKSWFQISIECGYCDYQHLVKDYKDFTGLTPNEFHKLENISPESVLGLTGDLYRARAAGMGQ